MSPPRKAVRILFADIDSTVREGFKELGKLVDRPEDVKVYPGALQQLRSAKAAGWRIVGITNQHRIAEGTLDPHDLMANLEETERQCEGMFELMMVCQHSPKSAEPYMRDCWCHKPMPGHVFRAVYDLMDRHYEYYPPQGCLFVGNRDTDRQCAINAGIPFMWAEEWRALGDQKAVLNEMTAEGQRLGLY